MYYYILQIIICVVFLLGIFKARKNKNRFINIISLLIVVLIFVNSTNEIIKIFFSENEKDFLLSEYIDKINISAILYWTVFTIYIYVGVQFAHIKQKEKIIGQNILGLIKKNKKKYYLAIIFAVTLTISAQFIMFKSPHDTVNELTDYNLNDDSLNNINVNDVKSILAEINQRSESEDIINILKEIDTSPRLKLIDFYEKDIQWRYDGVKLFKETLEQHKPWTEDLTNVTDTNGLITYEYGNYEIIELEYTIIDGREFKKCYTLIIYGISEANETIVCFHTIVDTTALSVAFWGKEKETAKLESFFEVLG